MKTGFLTIITILFFSFTGFNANAQDVKLGHVNIAELLKVMPSYKQAEIELKNFAKQLEGHLVSMQNEYQKIMGEYTDNQANMILAVRETKESEIDDLGKRIQTLQSKAQSQLEDRQIELLKPIEDKVTTAIKTFAKQNGYTYIFDSSIGNSLLFAEETNDVTAQIKAAIGL